MVRRNIIKIDEDLCIGCGSCVDACAEGAIELRNGKATVVSDSYCDGLGACIGECPEEALTIEERDVPEFDEDAAKAHVKDKNEIPVEKRTCPGSGPRMFSPRATEGPKGDQTSSLSTWPIQMRLVPTTAPYLRNASLLIAADCAGFACGSIQDFIKGRVAMIGCPKLDDNDAYVQKLSDILSLNQVKDITLLHMEVPCCRQLKKLVISAVQRSGVQVPLTEYVIMIEGGKAEKVG